MEPFSLKELQVLQDFPVKQPESIQASIGLALAYYSFIPQSAKAVVIFYHGAGFYSGAMYQYFAKQLAEKHTIGCYLFDIRGHGNSQGTRGDAPSVTQVWDDVTAAVNFVHELHPEIPLYIGGHSSGGGLIANYSNYHNHPAVKGYLFVAPYLGRNSGALKEHTNPEASFVKKVKVWVFILNALSKGYLFGHTEAVHFNYSDELLKQYPLVITGYTPIMMAATSPENPQALFAKIDKPFALFAAQNDEQFIATKLVEYKNLAPDAIQRASVAEIIPNTKHLDIMLNVADYYASWLKPTA